MKTFSLIVLAGGSGALARYVLSAWINSWAGKTLPWGTFTINITGCFLFGLIWTLAEEKEMISPQTSLIVLTGFVGSFTTFSTMAFEAFSLLKSSAFLEAGLYIIAIQAIGILSAFLGVRTGHLF